MKDIFNFIKDFFQGDIIAFIQLSLEDFVLSGTRKTFNLAERWGIIIMKRATKRQEADELRQMALVGYQRQLDEISDKMAEIKGRLDGKKAKAPAGKPAARKGKRKMSAAARKRISVGQKKRWAAFHREARAQRVGAKKKVPRLSVAGRRRISDAAKKMNAGRRTAKTPVELPVEIAEQAVAQIA